MQMQPEPSMHDLPGAHSARELHAETASIGAGIRMPAELPDRTFEEAYRRFLVHFLSDSLRRHNGCQIKAAVEAGVHRNTFGRLLLRSGIWPQEKRKVRGNRHA